MNTRQYLEKGDALTEEQREEAGRLFTEYRDQIETTVEALCNRYGTDAEEMFSESTAIFMAAFATYDKSIPFGVWLHHWVKWELLDKIRTISARRSKYLPTGIPLDLEFDNRGCVLDFVSADAQDVILMVLDSPKEFASMVYERGGKPRNYRSSLRDYLGSLGWTQARVVAIFQEIQTALVTE